MRELLVTKPLEYAASKTSSAADAATSPEMLAEGAIGIYYITKSTGAPTLIPAGTPTLAAAIAATELPVSKIKFIYAIGTATSCEVTEGISSDNILSVTSKEFAAGVKQGWYIGYNGTSGNIVIPTIATYDEAGIDVTVRRMGTNVEDDYALYNASLTVGDGIFEVASKICDAVNVAKVNPKALAEVNSNILGSAIAAGTSIAFVKGSNSATVVGTFTSLATGDYLQLGMIPSANVIGAAPAAGNVATYKVLTLAGGIITLDRAYSGETQTVSAAGSSIVIDNATVTGNGVFAHVTRTATAPTSVGVRVTSLDALSAIDVSTYGVIAPATIRTAGNTQSLGSGTPFLMKRLEDNMLIEAGNYQTLDATVPKAVSKLVSTVGYDTYQLTYQKNTGLDARVIANSVYFAFEDGTYTGTKAQVIFDTLIKLITGVNQTTVAQVTNSVRGGGTAAS